MVSWGKIDCSGKILLLGKIWWGEDIEYRHHFLSKKKNLYILTKINPLLHNLMVSQCFGRSLLKALLEKEKMLITSIFSFPRNFFYPFKDNGYPLTLYQTINFGLFQIEVICRQQFQIWWNVRKFSKWVENSGKGEIAGYKQFFLFPQCFQKICTADT